MVDFRWLGGLGLALIRNAHSRHNAHPVAAALGGETPIVEISVPPTGLQSKASHKPNGLDAVGDRPVWERSHHDVERTRTAGS